MARDSPVYAVHLVNRLVEAVERLGTSPLSGRVVPEFEQEELREVVSGSYRIVYLVQAEAVIVLRVVHSARAMTSLAERQPWETVE